MGNYTGGGKTVCPFYLKEAKYSITCEGLITNTQLMTRFKDENEKMCHQEHHCMKFTYKDTCPVAYVLTDEYLRGLR